ncbi:unnamed protein product [Ilex paraguariensis]|uniref:Uncharacterized protein n=1 Tax=Ilex paraguariensis TaxID=185542 RepID=A0ABC8UM46_9AQUA
MDEVRRKKPMKKFKQKTFDVDQGMGNRFEAMNLNADKQSLNLEIGDCSSKDQLVLPVSVDNLVVEEKESFGERNACGKKVADVGI